MKTEPISENEIINGIGSYGYNDYFPTDIICPQCSLFLSSQQEQLDHQYHQTDSDVITDRTRRMIDMVRSYEVHHPQPAPPPPNPYEGLVVAQVPYLISNDMDVGVFHHVDLIQMVPAAAGDGFQRYHPYIRQRNSPFEPEHHDSSESTRDLLSLMDLPNAPSRSSILERRSPKPADGGNGYGEVPETVLTLAPPAPSVRVKREPLDLDLKL